MGKNKNKRRERSENVAYKYKLAVLDILFHQKLQDIKFERLVREDFIKEIKDGESQSVYL